MDGMHGNGIIVVMDEGGRGISLDVLAVHIYLLAISFCVLEIVK